MFKFISFQTSEEFEKWQVENPDMGVFQFSPIVMDMRMQGDDVAQSMEAQTRVGLFIVYGAKTK